MRILKPITVCVDGLCYDNFPWGFGGGRLPEVDDLVRADDDVAGPYKNLFSDATALAGIHLAIQGISDKGTRTALEGGVSSALKAMEKRGAAQKIKVAIGG